MNCEYSVCGRKLNVDHVTLITTRHVRRFCSVYCIAESFKAHMERVASESELKEMRRWETKCGLEQ